MVKNLIRGLVSHVVGEIDVEAVVLEQLQESFLVSAVVRDHQMYRGYPFLKPKSDAFLRDISAKKNGHL